MSVRVFAPAKINLTLEVAPVRADGMHELQSVVVFADVGDWIEAAPSEGLALSVQGPFAEALDGDDDNLVLRAARALAAAAGAPAHAWLTLTKNLPIASGIGGGSADAAAALRALNTLWRLDWDEAALQRVGKSVGADVPVCIASRSAWMTGVGDVLTPIAAPPLDAVLVNPLQPLATGAVFRAFDAAGGGAAFVVKPMPAWASREEARAAILTGGNDLEAPARALMPALESIAATLAADPRVTLVRMSGSGATMVALTPDRAAAESLAASLSKNHPEWWAVAVRLGASA